LQVATFKLEDPGDLAMDRQAEWLAAYVSKCMVEAWGEASDELSSYGEAVGYRAGTAACIVRVEPTPPVMVRVMAKAVVGVRLNAKLLREINALNARSRVANVWWSDGDVVVECSLFAEAVDTASLAAACHHVATVANDIGVGFAAMFDGAVPYPPFDSESEHTP
jgi:T3SS (YopN, CesT) and YbjN peptide-binding chaperone 1